MDEMTPSVETLRDHFERIRDDLLSLYSLFQMIGAEIKSKRVPKGSLADYGYFFRELERLCDDRRKDALAFKELAGKHLALMVMQDTDTLNDTDADDAVYGKYARATVDLKMVPKIPKKGTPEFYALLEAMGVDPAKADPDQGGVLSINWKKAVEVATALVEQGKPPLPGLTDVHPQYGAVFTTLDRSTKD